MRGYYWPDYPPADSTVATLSIIFSHEGYEACADGNLESGYEKLVLYYRPSTGEFLHVARQMPDGRWTSKLGKGEDITHNSVEALEGYYGQVCRYMRKPFLMTTNG